MAEVGSFGNLKEIASDNEEDTPQIRAGYAGGR
jgi:hypothetical protein